ncbi:MAG UNVERIFIED_CONTAM: hypothetical protein LVR29_14965 [Microcystis novacekii LVE1205-3]
MRHCLSKSSTVSGCHLVFPPQSVADAGFHAVKQFFLDCERGTSSLQHDRVMLLGDGGAGKTTLSMALRLHADPAQFLERMRLDLLEKLRRWSAADMQRWLAELDPRDRCSSPTCPWCSSSHLGKYLDISFNDLLPPEQIRGLVVIDSLLRIFRFLLHLYSSSILSSSALWAQSPATCNVSNRLQRCVAFSVRASVASD